MIKALIRWALVAALAVSGAFVSTGVAHADVEDSAANNVQEGDNETESEQLGNANSGDSVGGQTVGIVSSGDASVDATNRSEDVDAETGDVTANNDAAVFTGLNVSDQTVVGADIENVAAVNLHEGDNEHSLSQSIDANSGDGVGGSVIGVVTANGGNADIVAHNTSEDIDIETGDVFANNEHAAFVGLNVSDDLNIGTDALGATTPTAAAADIDNVAAPNIQEGDNEASVDQSIDANSGDGVGGQVIGGVVSGDLSIDATNVSEDVDVETGDVDAFNTLCEFVGLNVVAGDTDVACAGGGDADGTGQFGPITTPTAVADVTNVQGQAANVQEGDNESSFSQSIDANSGDGVGGQVIGAVASGSAEIVADNTSEDVDIETGDVLADNEFAAFVGLNFSDDLNIGGGALGAATPTAAAADIDNVAAANVQEGDNDLSGSQDANGASGDGVGGQVIGAVSGGDASIDASNVTEDADVETGDADATNAAAAFVGLNVSQDTAIAADISNVRAVNLQEGDNDHSLRQSAGATSGDAVAGQVAGVVTSAGGSADGVFDNTSEDVDVESGDGNFDNTERVFVGLNFNDTGDLLI